MNWKPEPPTRGPDPLDCLLAEARWAEPTPEAIGRLHDKWQSLIASPPRPDARTRARRMMKRTIMLAAAAAVLVCVWLGTSHFANHGPGDAAFAQTLEQIAKAKTVIWKITSYQHATSKDGKRTWLLAHTMSYAYKSPGLWHVAPLDKNCGEGFCTSIEIKDYAKGIELYLNPTEKRAVLRERKPWDVFRGPLDPFREQLEKPSLQWIEKRKTPRGEVNVFRYAFKDDANKRNWSYDYWIDSKTKQLVEVHEPVLTSTIPRKTRYATTCPGKRHGPCATWVVCSMTSSSTQKWMTRCSALNRPRAMSLSSTVVVM